MDIVTDVFTPSVLIDNFEEFRNESVGREVSFPEEEITKTVIREFLKFMASSPPLLCSDHHPS